MFLVFVIFSDSLILSSDIKYKNVAIAIARVETGNYTSKNYFRKNNLFGFSTSKGVIKYHSKQSSINSYIKFESRIIRKYNIKGEKQYLNRISRTYSRHPKIWKQKVLKNLKKIN